MSAPFSLSSADIRSWIHNLAVFASPLVILYLLTVSAAVKAYGVTFSDFVPDAVTVGAMALYVLNATLDIMRKFVKDSTVVAVPAPVEPPVEPAV